MKSKPWNEERTNLMEEKLEPERIKNKGNFPRRLGGNSCGNTFGRRIERPWE